MNSGSQGHYPEADGVANQIVTCSRPLCLARKGALNTENTKYIAWEVPNICKAYSTQSSASEVLHGSADDAWRWHEKSTEKILDCGLCKSRALDPRS